MITINETLATTNCKWKFMYLCNGVEVRLYLSGQRRRDRLAPRLLRMRGTITGSAHVGARTLPVHWLRSFYTCYGILCGSSLYWRVYLLLVYLLLLVMMFAWPTFMSSRSLQALLYIINDMFKDGDIFSCDKWQEETRRHQHLWELR